MAEDSFLMSQRKATKIIYIIGMTICSIGIVIPLLLKDFYTFTVMVSFAIIATLSFFPCFYRKRYTLYIYISALELSLFLFPSIMFLTPYPQQAIIYQFITPSIWSLAVSDKKKFSHWPLLLGLFMAIVNFYKLYTVLGLAQGIEYAVIFYVIFTFLYSVSYLYIHNTRTAYQQLKDMSKIDYITSAYNRLGITTKLEELIKSETPFYFVYLDIDNFKTINDSLGHSVGDKLLKDITEAWWKYLYDVKGCIGRLGGDEFAMIIESNDHNYVADVIKRALKVIYQDNNRLMKNITFSAGITAFPQDTSSIEELFVFADTAMYKAKASGKNTYQFFDKKLYNQISSDYSLKSTISDAIENDKFTIVYQPQIDTKTKTVYGYEALLRLDDENGNRLNTQHVVNIAEKTGLIYDLDIYILNKVTIECKPLLEINPNLIISINISGKHLTLAKVVDDFIEVIRLNNFNPNNLCLEITETSFISSLQKAKDNIKKLNEFGIRLALDDFGMGYSSLSYLSELKVDHIKIEKFFTDNIFNKKKSGKIPRIIINIGHVFNYIIIAEGVETEDQKKYLEKEKCDIIQGYYYSKPLSLKKAIEYLNLSDIN